MARRYHEIKGLAEYTAKVIVSDEQEWKKFLHTAGHMYKYPFREQMLIYAQRPDATACASLELWNEKMNCWVNKGAQGIALIDEEGVHRSGLKYVFDVKDVHEARFIGRKPRLWRMEEEHKGYVIDSLEKIYGETDASRPFENRIMELATKYTQIISTFMLPCNYYFLLLIAANSSSSLTISFLSSPTFFPFKRSMVFSSAVSSAF